MSIVGQSVHSTFQYSGTDYGTSELESIARKKADEPVGANGCVGSAEGFWLSFRTETQPGFGTGRTKYYPSDSAGTLLKSCFPGNPATQNGPIQQIDSALIR